MRDFVARHAGLVLELARDAVGARRESVDADNVAQEVIATLLGRSADPGELLDPVAFLRPHLGPAIARARTRRRLIERVAEGAPLDDVAEQSTRIDVEGVVPSQQPARGEPIARAAPEVTLVPRVAVAAIVDPARAESVMAAWKRAGAEPIARGPGRVVAFVEPSREAALVAALSGAPHAVGRSEAMPLVSSRATDRIELTSWRAAFAGAAAPTRSVILRTTRTRALAWLAGLAAIAVLMVTAFAGLWSPQPSLDVASSAGELSFAPATPQEEGALVAFDANGARVGAASPFARGSDRRLHLAFASPPGAAVAFVIAGEPAAIAALQADLAHDESRVRSLGDREALVRAQARARNVRVARVDVAR